MERFYEILDNFGPFTWLISSLASFFATTILYHYSKKFYHILYMIFFGACAAWGALIVGGVNGILYHICMGILPFIGGVAGFWGIVIRIGEFIKIKKQNERL